MTLTDEELDSRLDSARISVSAERVPVGTASRLIDDTRSNARSRKTRVRITALATAVAVLAGGALAAPAAADVVQRFLAQSDWNPAPGGENLPDSEYVDTSAADLPEYIASIYPEWLPLAPGQTKEGLIADVATMRAANPGLGQEVGLRRDLEHAVYVGWIGEWIAAHEVADSNRMDAAIDVLEEAPDWPAFVATDGGGISDLMRGFVAEMAAGDAEAAQAAAQYELAPSWDGTDRSDLIRELFEKYIPEAL